MSLKNFAQFALALLLIGTVWVGVGTAARAQESRFNVFEFDKVDFRDALRQVFKGVGVSYTIAPELHGTVTVSLNNVTFETALQSILRQIDATYRVEAGVYEIIPSRIQIGGPDPSYVPLATGTGGIINETLQDGRYLYIIRGDQLYKVEKSDLKVIQTGSLSVPNKLKMRT